MFKKNFLKFSRSLIKKILPILFHFLIKLKINRRVINFLSEKSHFSNNKHDFSSIIKKLLENKKIIALDVGAQGGFNSDNFFPKRYNCFFDEILVEPIKSELEKLNKDKKSIHKGLWSQKEIKKLFILGNRLGSSSMFKPDLSKFDIHNIKDKDFEKYKITQTLDIECDTIENLLDDVKIKNLDYLKIDTQGAELDILKGLGILRPLLIKVEAHIFSMYEGVPSWHNLLNYLYELNYVTVDWKGIGNHNSRVPAEMDMIFIPNFNNNNGKKIILDNKNRFISLMLIFGQLNILKVIMSRFNLNSQELEKFEDLYFN